MVVPLEYITPQILLMQHFVILGILVTLISISSSLSREVRYKFIRKYFWTQNYFLIYLGYFLFSFLISLFLYLSQNEIASVYVVTVFLFETLFFYSVYLTGTFLQTLDRDMFNRIIIKEIKKSFKEKNEENQPLKDFFSNLLYIYKNNLNIDEGEKEILKTTIKYSLNTNQTRYIEKFIEEMVNEEKIFGAFSKTILSLLYRLKSKGSLREIIIYQGLLFNLIKNNFLNTKEFSRYLNTSGLYLKEFLDRRYGDIFEKTNDKDVIEEYNQLISNTINFLYELNKYIIELKIDSELKYEYLSNQIPELNKCLEDYNPIRETDFFPEYYNLIFKKENERTEEEKEKLALFDEKKNIIEEARENLLKRQLKLFYFILSQIDEGNLSSKFFNLTYKFFKIKGFKERFDEFLDIDLIFDFDLDKIDTFASNVGSSSGFKEFRYRLIIYFYEFLQNEKSLKNNLESLKKENFTRGSDEIKKMIIDMDTNFVENFFKLSKKDSRKLSNFKNKIISQFELKKKEKDDEEKKYIATTSLEDKSQKKHKEKFEKDCFEIWEKTQNKLKEIFKYEEVEKISGLKDSFGRYRLYPKRWFLESFYKNIGLDRSAGKDFGRDQIIGKEKQIFKEIGDILKKMKTYKLSKFEEISSLMNSEEKEYYLVYGKDFNIYTISGIDWKRKGSQTGEIKIGGYTIHFIYNHYSEENFLFEREAFILEQNKRGFKNAKSPFHIEVRDLSKEQISQILKKDKTKIELDVKQNVSIRISEQFKIKKSKSKRAYKIRI